MRAHTQTCPCCNATISAAIHPDDFKCPNGKRRANGGIIIGGSLTVIGRGDGTEHIAPLPKGGPGAAVMAMSLTGPKGIPGTSSAASRPTIYINTIGITEPREIARSINEQFRRQLGAIQRPTT